MSLKEKVEELERENEKLEMELKSFEDSVVDKLKDDEKYFSEYIRAILFLSKFRFEDIKMYELREKIKNTKIQEVLRLDSQINCLTLLYRDDHSIKYNREEIRCKPDRWFIESNVFKTARYYIGEPYIEIECHGEKTIEETLNNLEDAYKFEIYSLYLYLKEQLEEDKKLMQYKEKLSKEEKFDFIRQQLYNKM